MLDFINSNGVLFSGIFSIIVALISVLVSVMKDNKRNRADTIRSLRKELEGVKADLEKANAELLNSKSIENAEKNIDKSHGSIYYEKLADGKSRTICGFCWENKRAKMPLTMDRYYDDDSRKYVLRGYCFSCNANCYDK